MYNGIMNHIRNHWKLVIISILFLANGFVWFAVYRQTPRDYLTVAFLNIGQGDAIFIESPTHTQMMIDGGPPRTVLAELRKVMPFYDRSIDTLLITNPDADHFAGFIDVLNQYKISKVIEPGTHSDSLTYSTFEKLVKQKNIPDTIGKRGDVFNLGGGAMLEILYPDHNVSTSTTNMGSIIAKLSYKQTCVILTGDAPKETEEYLVTVLHDNIRCQVLKEGHHGSRTSVSKIFTEAVNPQYDVISAGVKNKYGHPHKETIDLMNELHIPILGTYEKGAIIMRLNGSSIETLFR